MTLASMTGFARRDGALAMADGERRWTWEARSVNGRGLDLRLRLPPGYDFIDPELRRLAGEAFARGSINATLTLRGASETARYALNRPALEVALAAIEEIRGRIDCAKPRAEGVLAVRGVIEAEPAEETDEERAALGAALAASFSELIAELGAARLAEGAKLHAMIAAQLGDIARLTADARAAAAAGPAALRDRLAAQLKELLAGAIAEDRLAQEAALLAVKADVREELDRLGAHIAAAHALIDDGQAAGRKLDFLTQEFNREANTLASKASDLALKRIGLDLKTVIDQMREQVQNIE